MRTTISGLSLFVAVLATVLVVAGLKHFSVFEQAVYYRIISDTGEFSINGQMNARVAYARFYKIKDSEPKPDSDSIRRPLAGVYAGASTIALAPRYYFFHPSFEVSEIWQIDVNHLFAAQIILTLLMFTWLTARLGYRIGAITSPVGVLIVAAASLLIFLSMNGRAAPAFLGYTMIAWSLVTWHDHKRLVIHAIVSTAGLALCAMSTGLFFAGITLFAAGNFTRVGTWLGYDIMARTAAETTWNKRLCDIAILTAAFTFCIPLLIRLLHYYGVDWGFFTGIFSHGAGRLVVQHFPLALAGFAVGSVAICVFVMSRSAFAVWGRELTFTFRRPLILAAAPLLAGFFGFTAATLSLVGLMLGLAQLFEFVWQSETTRQSADV